jgi:hypothetical protein
MANDFDAELDSIFSEREAQGSNGGVPMRIRRLASVFSLARSKSPCEIWLRMPARMRQSS